MIIFCNSKKRRTIAVFAIQYSTRLDILQFLLERDPSILTITGNVSLSIYINII
jgi:hypothetical protein